MSSTNSFVRWSSLLPISIFCLVLLLNTNSYIDCTNVASQVDSHMNVEHVAAHGNLTRRNSQFAMPIKRDRTSLILKSLIALITTVAIAMIIVRCLRQIKPNEKAQQYRRLSQDDACGTVRYVPVNRGSDIYPNALRSANNKRDGLNTIDPINTDKPTCDATKEAKQTKNPEGYVHVSVGEEATDLLKNSSTGSSKKTMSKRMIQKAKENRKALILAATGTVIALVVIVALAIQLRDEQNQNSKPHSEKLSENDEYIRKDTFESLQAKYNDKLQTEQAKYNTLQNDHTNLQTKFDNLNTEMQYTKDQYEALEAKYNTLQENQTEQQAKHDALEIKYNTLEEKYNNSTMDFTRLTNEYNQLFERNKDTKRDYQNALKNDVFFVMQSLDSFREIVKRGLTECIGKRGDAPFSGNTLQAMKLRWSVMPQHRQIPFLKVDTIYKEMKHIGPETGRSISHMKPILETMETTLDNLLNPTQFSENYV